MENLQSIAYYAGVDIGLDGANHNDNCTVVGGTTISGVVSVLLKSKICFSANLALVKEEESIFQSQKAKSYEVVQ